MEMKSSQRTQTENETIVRRHLNNARDAYHWNWTESDRCALEAAAIHKQLIQGRKVSRFLVVRASGITKRNGCGAMTMTDKPKRGGKREGAGRPATGQMERVAVRLPPESVKWLRDQQASTGQNASEVLRGLIEAKL